MAIGQVSLIVSLVLISVLVGIFPDEANVERQARKAISETIAAKGSLFITQSDMRGLETVLQVIVERNPTLLSSVVRRNGRVISEVGPHVQYWEPIGDSLSTNTQVVIPLWSGEQKWGQVELRFSPIIEPGIWGIMTSPVFVFLTFLSLTSFVAFFFYLGKMLKHLDPSQAVPDRVRSALDTMAEGLLVLDKNQNVVLANQSFSDMVERSAEKMIGVKASVFPWHDRKGNPLNTEKAPWTKALESGQVIMNQVVRLTLPNESRLTFMVNCSPVLLPGGKVGGVMVSLDDVTLLEEKELELRRSKEEAEAANRAKSDFLANMSHEIRTPMNAILGFADILRRDKKKLQTDQLKHINTISTSGQHLLDLINDILDLSKVESGRLEVEALDCKPVQLIHHVLQFMKVKADEKGLELKFVADTSLPEQIETDPGRVRQILTNLIGNAIKFTEQGGVTVHVSVVGDNPKQMKIAVVDTGIGMTQQQTDSVFEAFVQADSSITRRFGGTGLGLSISQKFAHALGGDILVTSEKGVGTTFTLVLEVGSLDSVEWLSADQLHLVIESEESDDAVEWEFPPAHVLVVDDGNENRELIKLVLDGLGLKVATAVHGQDGLTQALEQSFDLILMDVQMPVMDGYTAVAKMREEGIELPIVALTAHAMKGIEARCLEAGYSHYMTKPIDINALVKLMAELLGGVQVESAESNAVPVLDDPIAPVESKVSPDNEEPDLEPIYSTLPTENPKFAELVKTFIGRLQEKVAEIERAVETKDYEELANLAHWLKGSGGSVGFMEFTEPAMLLEVAAKESNGIAVQERFDEIQILCKRAAISIDREPEVKRPEPVSNSIKSDSCAEPLADAAETILRSTLPLANEKIARLVEQFLRRLEEQIDLLSRCVTDKDFVQIAELAHWLKGSAGSVGFAAFTEPSAELELAAKQQDFQQVESYYQVILELTKRVEGIDIEALPLGLNGQSESVNETPIHSSLLQANEKFRPIVVQFCDKLGSQINEMQDSLKHNKFQELADLAHWLKGSGGSVGFTDFTDIAAELENQAKLNNREGSEQMLKQIEALSKRIEL
ncbi:Hpt domain-containing protein [Neptuniibacter caesariensis]|uniref:histidine kinase n=1 Tax=Neptuniibacter caesariensis TaxID=207954 RepID=A0A7U8C4T0_NEPCE|nr:Hpt domain-containing protein [Neptuniibacter caesariensis]EAR61560.1 sensory transduction histidine kinase [Oceanospirillum sp. MED92] [Neptuniibacter caesariensis]